MKTTIHEYNIFVEPEGDSILLYIYKDADLILRQEYHDFVYNKNEVMSMGLSYVHEMLGDKYVI